MKILFIAFPDSIHAARWINQVSDRGWDIRLFPVYDAPLHKEFRNITAYNLSPACLAAGLDPSISIKELEASQIYRSKSDRVINRFWPLRSNNSRQPTFQRNRVEWLAWIIEQFKPDIIHSHEIQHSAYLTLEAKSKFEGEFPPWIVANWGSDIYLFGRLSEHEAQIKAVMANCNYYACECRRDVNLAREFGLKGEVLPVLPIGGGYDVKSAAQFRQPGPTSARRKILLKGYQGWAGRALVGLRAIELSAEVLKGYKVEVYLAAPEVKIAAELVSRSTGIPIEIVPYCSHEDMLRLHGRARISIGLSISDAISTSFLEAILMGSFPIQSNTACADEWVHNGETGMLVHPEDPEEIAAAIRRAVTDNTLVDNAAKINAQVVIKRLDRSMIKSKVIAMYEEIVAKTETRKPSDR